MKYFLIYLFVINLIGFFAMFAAFCFLRGASLASAFWRGWGFHFLLLGWFWGIWVPPPSAWGFTASSWRLYISIWVTRLRCFFLSAERFACFFHFFLPYEKKSFLKKTHYRRDICFVGVAFGCCRFGGIFAPFPSFACRQGAFSRSVRPLRACRFARFVLLSFPIACFADRFAACRRARRQGRQLYRAFSSLRSA